MAEPIAGLLDSARLLFDLQRANAIAESFAGYLEPEKIACLATDGLIERFHCAFARIWLMEADGTHLRLVASSGLYTRIDGSFARVKMGAYKVGKIAQNRVSFLSNHLAEEPWVKDRDWAIANRIRGFAGFPLMVNDQVIGVLATFSHDALAPEFLEVLQVLCTMVAVALATGLRYQQEQQTQRPAPANSAFTQLSLSDQLAAILKPVRLTLIGTEQPLTFPVVYVFLQAAEILHRLDCRYCRLIYDSEFIALEAIAAAPSFAPKEQQQWVQAHFGMLFSFVSSLGGMLQSQTGANQKVIQVLLQLPYPRSTIGTRLQIQCTLPVLQLAFSQLAQLAHLQISTPDQIDVPLLTDDVTHVHSTQPIIWIQSGTQPIPKGIRAIVDLQTSPEQLRQVVEAVKRGEYWGLSETTSEPCRLSEREREILNLLAAGLRDRDIAHQLIISESTVKFHINNVLSKLKARTRFQALHQAILKGWL